MSAGPTFTASQPAEIEFELRVAYSLDEWRKVRDALWNGKEGYFGPPRFLIDAIDSLVRQAERVCEPEKPEGGS